VRIAKNDGFCNRLLSCSELPESGWNLQFVAPHPVALAGIRLYAAIQNANDPPPLKNFRAIRAARRQLAGTDGSS
jgi:hypothetical protein